MNEKRNLYLLAGFGIILLCCTCFLAGVFYQRSQNSSAVQKEMAATKRLDAAAGDSSISVRGNVIKSESKKREEPIKQHFSNEQKTIKDLRDSLVIMRQFISQVARRTAAHKHN